MSGGWALAPAARAAVLGSDARIVVTGASGWLGRATLDLLAGALGNGFVGRVRCFGSTAAVVRLKDGTAVRQSPLAELALLPPAPTWVLHYAFLTKDRAGTMAEADYVAGNRAISRQVLASLDRIGTTAVFLPSSGAAAARPDAAPAMRLYGALKFADESAFGAWAKASGHRAVVARIYALAGPHLNKPEDYALAQFIGDALVGGPIRVAATRPVYRGFAVVNDLVSLALCLLARPGDDVTAFDAVATDPLEMSEIARIVADALGTGAAVVRPPIEPGLAEVYAADPAPYRRLCTEHGIALTPFGDAIRATAASIATASRWAA